MHLTMEGTTTEKLVEEVKKAAAHRTIDLEVLMMEFNKLCHKVKKPAE